MSAAVAIGDKIVWSEGFGIADLELDVPVTRQTKFRLGSVSKIFAASLTARLAETARVDLDQDIRSYLPEFPDKGQKITLRQLLGHQGGIRHYGRKDFDLSAPGGIIDLRFYASDKDILALFADDDLVATPGTKYAYTTFGYSLLSIILEKATGKPYLELLDQEILSPLKLKNVVGDDVRMIIAGRTRHFEKDRNETMVRSYPVNPAYKWAGGGMLGTADDLVRFGIAHYSPGFFAKKTFDEMFTAQKTSDGKSTNVGLGWRVGKDSAGRRIFHHAGSMSGCRALLLVFPDQKVAVSLLSNMTGTPGPILQHGQNIAELYLEQ